MRSAGDDGAEADADCESDALAVVEGDGDEEGVPVCVSDAVTLGLHVPLLVVLGDAVGLLVTLGVAERRVEGVAEEEAEEAEARGDAITMRRKRWSTLSEKYSVTPLAPSL